jgi:hypothetical protein
MTSWGMSMSQHSSQKLKEGKLVGEMNHNDTQDEYAELKKRNYSQRKGHNFNKRSHFT